MLRQLQELAAEVDRLNTEVDSLNNLLTSKDEEFVDLLKRNEEQYEIREGRGTPTRLSLGFADA